MGDECCVLGRVTRTTIDSQTLMFSSLSMHMCIVCHLDAHTIASKDKALFKKDVGVANSLHNSVLGERPACRDCLEFICENLPGVKMDAFCSECDASAELEGEMRSGAEANTIYEQRKLRPNFEGRAVDEVGAEVYKKFAGLTWAQVLKEFEKTPKTLRLKGVAIPTKNGSVNYYPVDCGILRAKYGTLKIFAGRHGSVTIKPTRHDTRLLVNSQGKRVLEQLAGYAPVASSSSKEEHESSLDVGTFDVSLLDFPTAEDVADRVIKLSSKACKKKVIRGKSGSLWMLGESSDVEQ